MMTKQATLEAPCAADAVLATQGRSFHWARRFLGPVHAARATCLYGFCRHIDDLADRAPSAEAARQELLAVADAIVAGKSADPVIADALHLIRECQIRPAIVLELINGVASDLDPVRIPDEDALLRYCFQVAGTVGLMMSRALDVSSAAALPHAIDLGVAMQLTNICRDIAYDAALGRRYLPTSMVGDMSPEALIDPLEPIRPRVRRCVAALLERADMFYRSGELGLSFLPVSARAGILVSARVYRAIGARLRRRNHAYWIGRVVVPDSAKTALTVHALLTATVSPSFWRHPRRHNAALHTPFASFPCIAPDRSAYHPC